MKRNIRSGWHILCAAAGIALIVLSACRVLDGELYMGFGGGLLGVGLVWILQDIRYAKDDSYREKIDVEFNDERNRYIRMKSWAFAGYAVVLIEALGIIAAAVMGKPQFMQWLSYHLCLIVAAYWIAHMVVSRRS